MKTNAIVVISVCVAGAVTSFVMGNMLPFLIGMVMLPSILFITSDFGNDDSERDEDDFT